MCMACVRLWVQVAGGFTVDGAHVVCHAFGPPPGAAAAAAAPADADYEPQRLVYFEAGAREAALPALAPNATFVHFATTLELVTAYEGYVRLVLPGVHAPADAPDPCADGPLIVNPLPGHLPRISPASHLHLGCISAGAPTAR